jgi:hypothetical protein
MVWGYIPALKVYSKYEKLYTTGFPVTKPTLTSSSPSQSLVVEPSNFYNPRFAEKYMEL